MVETAIYKPVLPITEPISQPEQITRNHASVGDPKEVGVFHPAENKSGQNFLVAALNIPVFDQESDVPDSTIEDLPENDHSKQNLKVRFSSNQDTGRVAISVVDAETDEVIREIPSEEMLKISQNLKENIGILFDSKL